MPEGFLADLLCACTESAQQGARAARQRGWRGATLAAYLNQTRPGHAGHGQG